MIPPAAEHLRVGGIAEDQKSRRVQAVDQSRGQLLELLRRVGVLVRAAEQAADATRPGVLPDARPLGARTEDRDAHPRTMKLPRKAFAEDSQRRMTRVGRQRHWMTGCQ